MNSDELGANTTQDRRGNNRLRQINVARMTHCCSRSLFVVGDRVDLSGQPGTLAVSFSQIAGIEVVIAFTDGTAGRACVQNRSTEIALSRLKCFATAGIRLAESRPGKDSNSDLARH